MEILALKQLLNNIDRYPKIAKGAGNRLFWRINSGEYNNSVIMLDPSLDQFEKFNYLTVLFNESGIRTPKLLQTTTYDYQGVNYYVSAVSDLGQDTLLQLRLLELEGKSGSTLELYESALTDLVKIQHSAVDFTRLSSFDERSILQDLTSYHHQLLDPLGINPGRDLYDEFAHICQSLESCGLKGFMYRDFNARNIVVGASEEDSLGYVDFQGGRRGFLLYDVISLLFQSSANLSSGTRQSLLKHYLEELRQYTSISELSDNHFDSLVIVRLLQTLGVYGKKGLTEKDPYFKSGIINSFRTVSYLKDERGVLARYPALYDSLQELQDRIRG